MCLVHLEEEDTGRDKDKGSNEPNGIEGVTEEFMVHLVRAVKTPKWREKCCYHCSSLEHFICKCLLMKTLMENTQLNGKEGMVLKKGAKTLQQQPSHQRTSRQRFPRSKATPTDPFLNSDPFQCWHGVEM